MFLQRMRNKTIQKVNQINKKKNKDQGQDHEKRRRVFENLEKFQEVLMMNLLFLRHNPKRFSQKEGEKRKQICQINKRKKDLLMKMDKINK